jgi:hypothetical protein
VRKCALFAICLVFVPALGQGKKPVTSEPFRLKGDVLAETIQEFRQRHPGKCSTDKVGELEVLPADVDVSAETEDEQRAKVVKCIADESSTVAGVVAYRTVYYFFHEGLYKIESDLPRTEYVHLRKAFTERYGPPSAVKSVGYQNGFGAHLVGERLYWYNPVSSLAIGELDSESNNVRLVFRHKALYSECEKAGSLKNRAGDL